MSKQRFNKIESIFIFVSHLFVLVQNICLKVEDNIKTTKITKIGFRWIRSMACILAPDWFKSWLQILLLRLCLVTANDGWLPFSVACVRAGLCES